MRKVLVSSAAAILIAACTQQQMEEAMKPSTLAMVAGAAAGGFVGYQVGGGLGKWIFAALGAGVGGVGGLWVGERFFGQAEQAAHEGMAREALNVAADGETRRWWNEARGLGGTFTPLGTVQNAEGGLCRDFMTTLETEDGFAKGEGRVCRNAAGAWIPSRPVAG